MSYLKDFLSKIKRNAPHECLKLWEEYCYSEKPDAEELIQILREIKNSQLASFLGNYIDRALFLLDKVEKKDQKDQILKLILDIQNINTEELANLAIQSLKEKYQEDKYFKEKIRLVGLSSRKNFQGAISNFELLNHLKKGNFVFHTSGWGVGEILDLSILREEMTLEFEYEIEPKQITFRKALNTLIPIEKTHFLARRFGDPDILEEEAKEHPQKVIALLLRDLGPKTAIEIKDEICELVIPENEWSKWWQTARSKLKKSTMIEVPRDLKKAFKLRKKELSHEENLYSILESKPKIKETIQLVYSFLKDFPETVKNKDFKETLHKKLKDLFSCEEITDAQKLQLLFILEKLYSKEDNYSLMIKDIIKDRAYFEDLIEEVNIISFKKKVFSLIKDFNSKWVDIFLEQLFLIKQNVLKDYLLEQLESLEDKERLNNKLEQLLKFPTSSPLVFVWYFQKILKGKKIHLLSDKKSSNKFFENFMILLDHVHQKEEFKDLMKKMANLLTANRYKMVRDFFKESSLEEVKEILLLSTKCKVLSLSEINIIHSLAEVIYPSLKKFRKKEKEEKEEIIWTTKEGFEKARKKIEKMASFDMIENAKEIEEARSLGDLRENAEYKAALEKRDRLQSQLKMVSDQLKKTKILTKELINTDKVNIGCIVDCEDDKKNKLRITILGPLEANLDENIFSFQSKLVKSIIGLKVGDRFIFQKKEFVIKKISNFFK